jgi:ribulose-5-phosphate 4-epimerase/fuculose-1-phosphate aldolase
MCQEGIQLVKKPLPVYPHVKTVWSQEEGMDVAARLGNSRAIILQGHGASTCGDSLEAAVTSMMLLEEQAKMNWYAYCAAGPDYPYISDELIDEMTNRTNVRELPHFKAAMDEQTNKLEGGVWQYFTHLVSKDL